MFGVRPFLRAGARRSSQQRDLGAPSAGAALPQSRRRHADAAAGEAGAWRRVTPRRRLRVPSWDDMAERPRLRARLSRRRQVRVGGAGRRGRRQIRTRRWPRRGVPPRARRRAGSACGEPLGVARRASPPARPTGSVCSNQRVRAGEGAVGGAALLPAGVGWEMSGPPPPPRRTCTACARGSRRRRDRGARARPPRRRAAARDAGRCSRAPRVAVATCGTSTGL